METMHRVWLTADNGILREKVSIDGAPARWHVSRERHGDGREASQALFDHGIEVEKFVKRSVARGALQLLIQAVLDPQVLRPGQLPHQEA